MFDRIVAVVPVGTDPEAAAIARLCERAGIPIHGPRSGGKPVHAGNAYRTDEIVPPLPPDCTVWRVECDGPAFAGVDPARIVLIDHHRPGDPGYGRPPEEFLPASSIGQVFARLTAGEYASDGGHWVLTDRGAGATVKVPTHIVFVAAADHCLEAAYRGRCPGVDPDTLMQWRAESRASFQGRTAEAVLADVEAARKRLREASGAGLADLRGESIPELPEAAAREGIPFIATVADRDGRTKTVLQAAPAELVRQFLAGEIVPGLTGIYGDPARGFAGGYDSPPQ